MSHPFSSDSITNQYALISYDPPAKAFVTKVEQLEARIAELESRLAAVIEERNHSRNTGAARNRTPLIKDNASV